MDVSGRHENIPYHEIATPGAAQSGHMPIVEEDPVRPAEIAAEKRRIRIIRPDACQHHEARRVMCAAAERPAPGKAITTRDDGRRTDRSGRAGDEGARVGKPLACDVLTKVATDPAHASAVADQPADGAVERRGGFDDAHELEG